MNTENKQPYTWAKLKEFCNTLNDEQLSQNVKVISEDESNDILNASEIGENHYLFYDEDYSFTEADFDPEMHCGGKYTSFIEALENEPYVMTPASAVFLYEDF